MELKVFIAESLKAIIDGVNEAKEYGAAHGAVVNPRRQYVKGEGGGFREAIGTHSAIETVQFDVAVTVDDSTQTRGGIAVAVGIIGLGSTGQSTAASSSVSRLQFIVPVSLPYTENDPSSGRERPLRFASEFNEDRY